MKHISTIFSILFFNSFCFAESPEDYWQEYENQYRSGIVKNVVEHVQNLSNPMYGDHEERLRRSRAITYFLSTGGKYGFRQTPATDTEQSIIENSISFVAGYYPDELIKTDDFFSRKFKEYNPNQTPTPTIITHLGAIQTIAKREYLETSEYLANHFSGFRQFLNENSINGCKLVGKREGFIGFQNSGVYKVIGRQEYFGKVVKRDLHDREDKKYSAFRKQTQKDEELREILTLPIAVYFNEQYQEVLQIMPFCGSMIFEEFSTTIEEKGDAVFALAKQKHFFAVFRKIGHGLGVLCRNQIFPADVDFCNAGSLRVREDGKFSFVDCGAFYHSDADNKQLLRAILSGMCKSFLAYNHYAKTLDLRGSYSHFLSHVHDIFDLNCHWDKDRYNLITQAKYSQSQEFLYNIYLLHRASNIEDNDQERTLPTLEKLADIYSQHEENKFMVDRINNLLPWRSWLRPLFLGFLDSCSDLSAHTDIINILKDIQEQLSQYKKSPAEWYTVDPNFWTAIFLQQSVKDVVSFIEQR